MRYNNAELLTNQSVSVITTVTINLTGVDHTVTTIYQFCLHISIHVRHILFFFSKEKRVLYSECIHLTALTVSLY